MKNPHRIVKIDQGYRVYDDLFKPLGKSLKEWLKIMREYAERTEWDDAPYWFLERTNVGIFASAIWRAKGIALEEFDSLKKNKEGEEFTGRVDLYYLVKDEEYYVEFKQDRYVSLTRGVGKGAKNTVHRLYKAAKGDLAKAKVPGVKGLFGLFLVPYTERPDKEDITRHIREYLNWLVDEMTPDVLAWWFPEETRDWERPGIILFLRRAKK